MCDDLRAMIYVQRFTWTIYVWQFMCDDLRATIYLQRFRWDDLPATIYDVCMTIYVWRFTIYMQRFMYNDLLDLRTTIYVDNLRYTYDNLRATI